MTFSNRAYTATGWTSRDAGLWLYASHGLALSAKARNGNVAKTDSQGRVKPVSFSNMLAMTNSED